MIFLNILFIFNKNYKDEAFDMFILYKVEVENQLNKKKLKC